MKKMITKMVTYRKMYILFYDGHPVGAFLSIDDLYNHAEKIPSAPIISEVFYSTMRSKKLPSTINIYYGQGGTDFVSDINDGTFNIDVKAFRRVTISKIEFDSNNRPWYKTIRDEDNPRYGMYYREDGHLTFI